MNKIGITLLDSVSLIKQVGDADSICFIEKVGRKANKVGRKRLKVGRKILEKRLDVDSKINNMGQRDVHTISVLCKHNFKSCFYLV